MSLSSWDWSKILEEVRIWIIGMSGREVFPIAVLRLRQPGKSNKSRQAWLVWSECGKRDGRGSRRRVGGTHHTESEWPLKVLWVFSGGGGGCGGFTCWVWLVWYFSSISLVAMGATNLKGAIVAEEIGDVVNRVMRNDGLYQVLVMEVVRGGWMMTLCEILLTGLTGQ